MKRFAALCLLASSTVYAAPFADGNVKTGKKIFEQKQCNRCHEQMVEGNGSAVFTRKERKVHKSSQLIQQINMCAAGAGIALSKQEEQHLAAYLNHHYYKLP